MDLLSTQLDEKLRVVDETHPSSPIPDMQESISRLESDLLEAEANIMDMRLKLQITTQKLEHATEERAAELSQHELIMEMHQSAKIKAHDLTEEQAILMERLCMAREEIFLSRSQAEALRHQLGQMMRHASIIFGPGGDGRTATANAKSA